MKRRSAPNPDKTLHQNSPWWFVCFSLFVLLAFWPSYFSHLFDQTEIRLHLHGLAMTLWCAMLISQAYLIRKGLRQTHRWMGKLSYALAPFIVLATVNLVHFRLKSVPMSSMTLYLLALMLNAVVAFAVLYGLAMYHRHSGAVHARYMVCTAFPLFTPVTDRLVYAHFPALLNYVPVLDGNPQVQVIGFLLADALLLALTVWDWKSNHRTNVFPGALGILVTYHLSVLIFYQVPLWNTFGAWFLKLPFS